MAKFLLVVPKETRDVYVTGSYIILASFCHSFSTLNILYISKKKSDVRKYFKRDILDFQSIFMK